MAEGAGRAGGVRAFLLGLALVSPAPAMAAPLDRWALPIASASARFGIPGSWIRRVIRIESGGLSSRHREPVVSRAGAMGLMQLMPGTWAEMRAMLGLGPDPFDPEDNIRAGAAYLRLLYDRFGYPGLFAAYNAGPGRYADFVAGNRPLPRETRAYLAAAARGQPGTEAMAARGPAIAAGRPEPRLFAVLAGAGADSKRTSKAVPNGLFVTLAAPRL